MLYGMGRCGLVMAFGLARALRQPAARRASGRSCGVRVITTIIALIALCELDSGAARGAHRSDGRFA